MIVRGLWQYPIASFSGESCGTLHLSSTGPCEDRRFVAVRLPGLEPASPERDAAWRRAPDIEAQADPPMLRLPGEGWLAVDDPETERALTRFFGFPVGLRTALPFNRPDPDAGGVPVRAPRQPLHLITSWQLETLRSAVPQGRIAVERFRPNLLIEASRAETDRIASKDVRLRIGDCAIEIVEETVRCGFVALAQAGLPRDGRILKHLRRNAGLRFGFGCRIREPGRLSVGDRCEIGPC